MNRMPKRPRKDGTFRTVPRREWCSPMDYQAMLEMGLDPEFGWKEPPGYHPTFCDTVPLHLDPHYTDKRFDKEQTVYGRRRPGLAYDYSDRLWGWDYEKMQAAVTVANMMTEIPRASARWLSLVVSFYHQRALVVHHVLAGVNCSNGYSYYVVGYMSPENEERYAKMAAKAAEEVHAE